MMYSSTIIASSLLLVAGAMGQTPTAGAGSNLSGPDGNLVNVQVVQVSDMNSTLKFNPEEIKAEPGSMVQFQFYPKVSFSARRALSS
jgi:plastocyanin